MAQRHDSLRSLLVLKLQALLDVEREQSNLLARMADAATDPPLAAVLREHATGYQERSERLRTGLVSMSAPAEPIECEGARGMNKDGEWVMGHVGPPALDAALIAAAQYMTEYAQAGYGAAREWAKLLGYADIADMLMDSLDETKAADAKLNELAISRINARANTDHG